jgi:hypothetical protein
MQIIQELINLTTWFLTDILIIHQGLMGSKNKNNQKFSCNH